MSRQDRLPEPTNLADTRYETAEPMLRRLLPEGPFGLIGIGLSELSLAAPAAPALFDQATPRRRAEAVTDAIRARFGKDTIIRGRALR